MCSQGRHFRLNKVLDYRGRSSEEATTLQAPFSCTSGELTLRGEIAFTEDPSSPGVYARAMGCELDNSTSAVNVLDLLCSGGEDAATESERPAEVSSGTPTAGSTELISQKLQREVDLAVVDSLAVVADSSCKEKQLGSGEVAADSEKQDAAVNTTTTLDQASDTVLSESRDGATGVVQQQCEVRTSSSVAAGSVDAASGPTESVSTGRDLVSSGAIGMACDSSNGGSSSSSSSSSNACSTTAGSLSTTVADVRTAAAAGESSAEAAGQPLTLKRKAGEDTVVAAVVDDLDEAAVLSAEVSAHKRQRQVPVQAVTEEELHSGSSSGSNGSSSSGEAASAAPTTTVGGSAQELHSGSSSSASSSNGSSSVVRLQVHQQQHQ
jgi:hypothetical protein